MTRTPRGTLLLVLAVVVVVAGAGWGVSTLLRSPADEAAARKPPRPSLVTATVERRKLVSTIVVSSTLEYGSPYPVSLAGVVGGGDATQRATRAPRPGMLTEGAVVMEVNGRPVFVFSGKVPMHRGIVPGTRGDDVRQLQKALRRLGHRAPVTGVFDQATIAAVSRFYAKRDYEAQQPTLELRQKRDDLRRAVRSAQEVLATERKALDQGMDVLPLKVRLANARRDLEEAGQALDSARAQERTIEDEAEVEAAESAVRAAEEKLLAAEQELAQARTTPTPAPTPAPGPGAPAGPPADTRLLELRVANARADSAAARSALERVLEEAGVARDRRLAELGRSVRLAREAVAAAEQTLRQARQLSPTKLKVANAQRDLAAARALLAEFSRTYGPTIPPGEIVFLPRLPARLHKATVKAGEPADKPIATVTSSTFVVSGSVDAAEAERLKTGLNATIETEAGKTVPGTVTSLGGRDTKGAVPVMITPASMKGLKKLAGAPVTARVTIGATDQEVLVVPAAAVVTAADGRARVQVEIAPDRTKEVEVRTGLAADGAVEVTGDLKPGDLVVINSA
ncbi:peptidoglycan-binding protein [Streptosporangium roseum]|uniref:Peptidoglycan binding domain-containing protein n=1 Tax=Streptosporangium roseum (strain ATCC 12428 / DSM 43021 / JCM 3005 / KCTC 9067 / NCIMB 10171 / NRRL 2505 / NI 9100) TaxID=479432 RepID=D2AZY0_STRRD|nr:peptidoglycan-binding protein [Streptosporangium roseum]ACZ87214.1 peptidoglycan binding domain-containing protein [Streptosporangium roseum DSM 43021]